MGAGAAGAKAKFIALIDYSEGSDMIVGKPGISRADRHQQHIYSQHLEFRYLLELLFRLTWGHWSYHVLMNLLIPVTHKYRSVRYLLQAI